MKKAIFLVPVIVLTFMVTASLATAGCPTEQTKGSEGLATGAQADTLESKEVVNTICPIMDNPVERDTPYKVEYDGKVIGFCCQACVDKFNKDPEAYLQNLEVETKAE